VSDKAAALVATLEFALKAGALSQADFARAMDTTWSHVDHWRDGSWYPAERNEQAIFDLVEILRRLDRAPGEARLWLYGRHKALRNRRPIDLFRSDPAAVFACLETEKADG
jgi:hypothetical protein